MPVWVSVVVAVVTPLLAFAGAALSNWVTRRNAVDLDRWRHREETMRLLQWGVELATDPDEHKAAADLTVLGALLDSELLQTEDVEMVSSVATAIALDELDPSPGQRYPG